MVLTRWIWIACALAAASGPLQAQQGGVEGQATTNAARSNADPVQGEVRKVDRENRKLTLKHGTIRNLDMPPMTMAFRVRDAAMLDGLKAGDKVRFHAEKINGAYMVTTIEPAR